MADWLGVGSRAGRSTCCPPTKLLSIPPSAASPLHPPFPCLQRDQVSAAVRDSLMKRATEFNILVDDVAITHLSFGTEFTKAVESKQVAQQEAERARFVVMKADQVGAGCRVLGAGGSGSDGGGLLAACSGVPCLPADGGGGCVGALHQLAPMSGLPFPTRPTALE